MLLRLFILAALLSGCANTVAMFSDDKVITEAPTQTLVLPFYVGGLFPRQLEFKSESLCSYNRQLKQAEVFYSAADVLLTAVTLNLYSPKSMRVWCR